MNDNRVNYIGSNNKQSKKWLEREREESETEGKRGV